MAHFDTSPTAMLRLSKKHLLMPGEEQPYDFIVVVDFEATCEADRSQQEPQEIIEFPALLVSTRDERVVDEFHHFVRPTKKPTLSHFCQQLTGITQDVVDKAEEFPAVIQAFLRWLEGHGLDPNHLTGPPFIFLTHGDWDLREMLPKQMEFCDLSGKEGYDAQCLRRWINLNPLFDASCCVTPGSLPRTSSGVESIAVHLQMRVEGRLHSGIDDARNIARILNRLLRFGVRVTPIQSTCHRCGLPGHFARECPHTVAATHSGGSNATAGNPGAVSHGAQGQRRDGGGGSGGIANGPHTSYAAYSGYAPHHHHHHHHGQHMGMGGMPMPPFAVQRRPGDWFCQECGVLVFARRTECFQCGAPRR